MAWVYLVIAGLFEMGWAIGLKYTEGFTRLTPTVLTVGAMIVSVVLLGIALRDLQRAAIVPLGFIATSTIAQAVTLGGPTWIGIAPNSPSKVTWP